MVAAFSALLLAGLVSARPAPKVPSIHRPHEHLGKRSSYTPPATTAPYSNIFNSLSNDEAAGVINFLHNQTSLNLTASATAGPWDNYIMVVDTYAPNKTDALVYLSGKGEAPARYAFASLAFGATPEPYVQDWVIGPLPISNETVFYPDTFSTKKTDAKIRIYDMDDTHSWLLEQVLPMVDIINDLVQSNVTNGDEFDEEFAMWGIDPLWREPNEAGEERIIYWAQLWRNGGGTGGDTLLPQGIYFRADITGRDPSQWAFTGILYGDEYYHSPDEFRAAWPAPGFIKYTPNLSGEWISTVQAGEPLPLETQPPPSEFLVGGQRFKVDPAEKYVEWMDFTFYITFTRDTGMRLFDVKYKGERIIYELGLQEAIAHYAGNDPVQSGIGYLDTYYGFGPFCFNQVPGYDMPEHAYCMDTTWHADELSKTRHCGISMFEEEMPYPLSRHTTSGFVAVTKNIAFTVRSISTVGNYDYNFDYVFYLDGSIETIVRASGYIQSAYYAKNEGYGYKIHDGLSGSMHDHVLQFKADLDIAGTNNTLVKHAFEPVSKQYKWSNVTRNTMELVKSEVTNEDQGKMNWAENSKEKVVVVNKDALNKYGEERGYLIMPSRGPAGMRLTVQNSTNLQKSGAIGTHQYYVTKHKDDEKRSVSAWNAYDPGHPLVNFDDFFDGESLEQEDLVLWFNLGMHHVPHTGDLPNTVFTTAQAGMWITPHNYLLSDPSRQSSQMIHIDMEEGVVSNVSTFGAEAPSGGVDFASWDAYSYVGDVAIRKFPYDPQNPFNDTSSI